MIPALEIGGTHVAAAWVDPDDWTVRAAHRRPLDPDAGAAELLDVFAAAALEVGAPPGIRWGVAMPDPFDYPAGIARFRDVGKFAALYGVDVGAALKDRLATRGAASFAFLNDADAFVLGEWTRGAAAGAHRCAGITLGTGVGSGWLVGGRVAADEPGQPPGGRAHRLRIDGQPLEELVSRRAIRAAYRRASDAAPPDIDVAAIAGRARAGEPAATQVLSGAMRALGSALARPLRDFGAEVVVIGGGLLGSWRLLEPWFLEGLGPAGAIPVRPAEDPDGAALRGAARFATDSTARFASPSGGLSRCR